MPLRINESLNVSPVSSPEQPAIAPMASWRYSIHGNQHIYTLNSCASRWCANGYIRDDQVGALPLHTHCEDPQPRPVHEHALLKHRREDGSKPTTAYGTAVSARTNSRSPTRGSETVIVVEPSSFR